MLPASPYCPCLNWKSRGLLYLARSPPLSPHCRHHITVPKRATSPTHARRRVCPVLESSNKQADTDFGHCPPLPQQRL